MRYEFQIHSFPLINDGIIQKVWNKHGRKCCNTIKERTIKTSEFRCEAMIIITTPLYELSTNEKEEEGTINNSHIIFSIHTSKKGGELHYTLTSPLKFSELMNILFGHFLL